MVGVRLQTDYNTLANAHGVQFSAQNKIYNFNRTGYDDLSSSGSSASGSLITGSCFFQPIDGKGGNDAQFLEQGLITLADRKAYIPSGAQILSNADFVVEGASYCVLSQHEWRVENEIIYTKCYLRSLVQV